MLPALLAPTERTLVASHKGQGLGAAVQPASARDVARVDRPAQAARWVRRAAAAARGARTLGPTPPCLSSIRTSTSPWPGEGTGRSSTSSTDAGLGSSLGTITALLVTEPAIAWW